jgi:hypothetical protein
MLNKLALFVSFGRTLERAINVYMFKTFLKRLSFALSILYIGWC